VSSSVLENSNVRLYTSGSALLFGSLSLVAPSGYSLGAVLLLLGGLSLPLIRPSLSLNRQDWLVMGVMALYALTLILMAWLNGDGTREFDRPSRFLLAIPALLLIIAYPPRLAFLWSGLAVGAITAGSWAFWQKIVEESDRAQGYTHVIQFGNLSMLMGVLCLAGLGWATIQRHRNVWVCFLLLGSMGGILGSLFSGSRGGWIGFPIVLWVLYRAYGSHLAPRLKVLALAVVVVGALIVYAVPQIGVQGRIHQAFTDVSLYVSGESRTSSVGARFEMWKGAGYLIADKPVLGWGENGYKQQMEVLANEGVVDSGILVYGHAHNEFIDAFAKRGILGVIVLLTLYLIPLRLFARHFSEPDLTKRSIAVAGVLLPVTYIDFGLTQVFLSHNSGVMMYAFLLAILWGVHSGHRKQLAEKASVG
jgi:O-antigen ligase